MYINIIDILIKTIFMVFIYIFYRTKKIFIQYNEYD